MPTQQGGRCRNLGGTCPYDRGTHCVRCDFRGRVRVTHREQLRIDSDMETMAKTLESKGLLASVDADVYL